MGKMTSILFLVIGLVMIFLAIRGLVIGDVVFVTRSDEVRSASSTNDGLLFWAIEAFYLFGGVVSALFGAKELRDNAM